MEIQTTETTENPTVLPVITTDATETLDQTTVPVIDHQQTTETTLEQSLSPTANTPAVETTPPEITNTQSTENLEHTTSPEVTNTHETDESNSNLTPVTITNTQSTETLDQSTVPSMADTKITESMEQSVTDNSHDNLISSPERQETAEEEEEIKSVLKDIAATGNFWYDWEKVRGMLSLHLKQVISEYPQAKMTIEEQKASLGESYAELVKRLDDALHSFADGPPFTLQRLSEIILDARSLYPKLSKLALALEKNLSVTSTLTISTDPNPQSLITTPNGLINNITDDQNQNSNLQLQSDTVMENGALTEVADRDEIMTDLDADVSDATTMDVETNEKSSEPSPMTTGGS